VLWQEVDLAQRQVEVNSTVIRGTGHGLVRKDTKTRAGRRILILPSWAVADLQSRWARGVRLEEASVLQLSSVVCVTLRTLVAMFERRLAAPASTG
jgi:hypothetical protein